MPSDYKSRRLARCAKQLPARTIFARSRPRWPLNSARPTENDILLATRQLLRFSRFSLAYWRPAPDVDSHDALANPALDKLRVGVDAGDRDLASATAYHRGSRFFVSRSLLHPRWHHRHVFVAASVSVSQP